jgi:hypothetical protein
MPRQSTTLKDGRPATYRNRVSERIKTSMIVDRLQKCVAGEITLTTAQVQAARILLDRVLPSLKAVEVPQECNGSKDIRSLSNAALLSFIDGSKK